MEQAKVGKKIKGCLVLFVQRLSVYQPKDDFLSGWSQNTIGVIGQNVLRFSIETPKLKID